MQVRHDEDGRWHRRAVLYGFTGCGKPAIQDRTISQIRSESYEGQLCRDGCFTAFELAHNQRINAERDR